MAELPSKVDDVASAMEEPTALQSKGIAQGALLVQHAARGAQEQIAAAQRRDGERRKLMRPATREAAGISGPKA